MCKTCTAAPLTPGQSFALKALKKVWDGVVVYDVSEATLNPRLLAVGHSDSLFVFFLIEDDGNTERVTDLLNQSHWLSDITAGRFPLVAR